MRSEKTYIGAVMVLLMAVFAIGKMTFVAYNHDIEQVSPALFLHIWANGALLDLRTAAIALLIPALWVGFVRKGARYFLIPYFCLLGIVVGSILIADIVMYEFWEFKLSAVVLSYAASPEGTTNSVSAGFLATRLLLLLLFVLLTAVPAIWLTPQRFQDKHRYIAPAVLIALALLPIGIGSCYQRGSLFQSHAATNPVYRFFHSFGDESRCMGSEDVQQITMAYQTGDEVTDTLLTTQRPNVLIVQLESFGGKFIEELGGIPDVAPNISRLIPEGIFWDRYYSNSFRTDRGTVCAYSGWISYPTVSPMKDTRMHPHLPSLSKSFREAGYQTGYMYAGAMTNMGKYQYVADMGFEAIMDKSYFTAEELNSSWGSNDGTAGQKMFRTIAEVDTTARWMMVWQTISSHEPWDVPYHRLEDRKLNAFAYTDQCLGDLVDSLKTLPVWDNLLVIIIPDHGFLYKQTYDESEFFHSPMLWVGGAIREPRRISTLMNQSDIAATLLAQMGLPHNDYPWSRNVLSPDYKPFVYCNYPAGFLFKDETGETMYDLSAECSIPVGEPADSIRLNKGLAILQASYRQLKGLR